MIVSCVGVSLLTISLQWLLYQSVIAFMALAFLIFSAIANVILDLYFITQFVVSVQSAGLANYYLARIVSNLLFLYSGKYVPELLPGFNISNGIRLYVDLFRARVMLVQFDSQSSLSEVSLQSSVNSLWSSHYQCSNGRTPESWPLPYCQWQLFQLPWQPFISQNFGAKCPERIVQGLRMELFGGVLGDLACVPYFFTSPSLVSFLLFRQTLTWLKWGFCIYVSVQYSIRFWVFLLIYRNSFAGLGKILPLVI